MLYLSSTSNHNLHNALRNQTHVVLYLSSTSNHNKIKCLIVKRMLCYIFLLHQTTTDRVRDEDEQLLCYIFLLHQTTTLGYQFVQTDLLCYIFLLHQTTTCLATLRDTRRLCYIFLLHQTTTYCAWRCLLTSCVISFFYIKPQQEVAA